MEKLSLHRPIFIIGFMGSGKTTLGKKLSRLANVPFIDLDQRIVEISGMPISDYFELHGESSFRDLEEKTLKSISPDTSAFISTGGGAPCFSDNIDWMNRHGLTVYLDLDAKVILSRLIASDRSTRPLLSNMDDKQLLSYIQDKLAERSSFYKKAKVRINPMKLSPKNILELLVTETQSM